MQRVTFLILVAMSSLTMAQDQTEFITAGTCVEILDTGDLIEAGIPTRFDSATQSYTIDLSLSPEGFVEIDALHKLEDPGQWLFSVKNGLSFTNSPQDPLAVAVGASVDPRDIVRFDGSSSYTRFFCGEHVTPKIPNNCNVDAAMLEGDTLVLSLDAGIPTGNFIDGENIERTDLIRYVRIPGACQVGSPTNPVPDTEDCCSKWQFDGLEFDATGKIETQAGQTTSGANVVGVSRVGSELVLSLDGPSLMSPSTRPDNQFLTGELVAWNGSQFRIFETLAGWPTNVEVNGLSLRAPSCPNLQLTTPADPADEIVDLCGATWSTDSGDKRLRVEWLPENGAISYNVYVGSLDDLIDISPEDNQPDGGYGFCVTRNITEPFLEIFNEANQPSLYYLLSANFFSGEGSLGTSCPAPCDSTSPNRIERIGTNPPACP